MNLKTDGTFLFSSGAADLGIGKMNFSETGYSVNGQEQKVDVEWYDLSLFVRLAVSIRIRMTNDYLFRR